MVKAWLLLCGRAGKPEFAAAAAPTSASPIPEKNKLCLYASGSLRLDKVAVAIDMVRLRLQIGKAVRSFSSEANDAALFANSGSGQPFQSQHSRHKTNLNDINLIAA